MIHTQSQGIIAGIDVGGTKTFVCIVNAQGQTLIEKKIPTLTEGSHEAFFNWLFKELKQMLAEQRMQLDDLTGIGMGFPGVIGDDIGILWNAPAFDWPKTDIRPSISAHFTGTIYLDNDVNMAVLGEQWKGAAMGHSNVIMVAIGTGIGSGMILNGSIYSGANHAAGEIGNWIVDASIHLPSLEKHSQNSQDSENQSDQFGPLEEVTSGTGIAKAAREYFAHADCNSSILDMVSGQLEQIETVHVLKAAAQGDEAARNIMDKPLVDMAVAIANAVSMLNPNVVVLGGGVADSGAYYVNEIRRRAEQLTPLPLKVVPALLGNEAGAYGAIAAVRGKIAKKAAELTHS